MKFVWRKGWMPLSSLMACPLSQKIAKQSWSSSYFESSTLWAQLAKMQSLCPSVQITSQKGN